MPNFLWHGTMSTYSQNANCLEIENDLTSLKFQNRNDISTYQQTLKHWGRPKE